MTVEFRIGVIYTLGHLHLTSAKCLLFKSFRVRDQAYFNDKYPKIQMLSIRSIVIKSTRGKVLVYSTRVKVVERFEYPVNL